MCILLGFTRQLVLFFMQDLAAAHTRGNNLGAEKWQWGAGVLYGFYLWDMLKAKECSKNLHTEYNLKCSTQSAVFFSVSITCSKQRIFCLWRISAIQRKPCLKHLWITLSRTYCWLVLTAAHLTETFGPWLTANWNCGRKWQTTLHR